MLTVADWNYYWQVQGTATSSTSSTSRTSVKPAEVGTVQVSSYSAAWPLFSWGPKSKKLLQYLSYRMFAARAWSIKCRRKEKLIAQFGEKLRDERFKPN